MAAVIYTPHFIQFFDSNGDPLSNGKLYTYSAGTTTPKATFTTADGDIELPNPVVLDSAGRATIFIEGSYRFDLFDSNDVLIKSTDDVISFSTLSDAGDPYFESFSGDNIQTVFVLSEDLGTDSKNIMVFIDEGLSEFSTNGDFSTDTDWTKGTGWTIGSGVATASTASTALTQEASILLTEGQLYNLSYTVTRSAGTIIASIGGNSGTSRNAAGTYTESIIAGSSQAIAFTGTGFTGTIDNVTVTKVQSSGLNVTNPNSYSLNGTSLTFNTSPREGSNNILVYAPTKLLGAASAAASLAQSAQAGAEQARDEAEAAAGLLDIVSTTSVTIATGTKVFTIEADKSLVAGQYVQISSDADTTNYVYGTITSYVLTTLTVEVLSIGGGGTFSDWTIRLTGPQGIQGDAGTLTAASSVTAGTSAGAALKNVSGNDCASWGGGNAQDFNVTNTLSFFIGGASVNEILDEDDLASDSPIKLATQQSIKAYVDALTSGIISDGSYNIGDLQIRVGSGVFSSSVSGTTKAVTFNTAFDTACLFVHAVIYENVSSTGQQFARPTSLPTTTGVVINMVNQGNLGSNTGYTYIAIGY